MRGSLVLVLLASACSTQSSTENSTCGGRCDTPEQAQAKKSLQLLGANVDGAQPRCHDCHSLTKSGLRNWLSLTQTAKSSCLDPAKAPLDAVNCLRADPASADSPFMPSKLGIYAAQPDVLQPVFKAAYPAGQNGNNATTWVRNYTRLKQAVQMPRGNFDKLSSDDFKTVEAWFNAGLPALDDVLPEQQPPASCVENWSDDLAQHVARMKNEGWSAVNRDRGLSMLPLDSLADALATDYGRGWATGATFKVLKDLSFTTTFWTRSSPDGRYVAAGGEHMLDLQTGVVMDVSAAYDPGFFPDNSGFVEQGTSVGAGFCSLSLLSRDPAKILFNEPECSGASIGLYQYLGAALGGGDYFVVSSQFDSDNGGHGSTTGDPAATFGDDATIKLTPMVFDGAKYQALTAVTVPTQFEGDTALSPSSLLIAGRLAGPDAKQIGYVIRKVNAVKDTNGYTVTAPEIARVCVNGAKASFSLDERFLVTHHYGDNVSNLVLVDLQTHQSSVITNMSAGQYALYPHFRSDGWIHFLVRDSNTHVEHVIATDAALRIQ
jgi:hypothetical protein